MSPAARGTEEFLVAARLLNEAGDKAVRTKVYAAFRDAAKPLGRDMLANAGRVLPKRGGLAARVEASKLAQSNSTTGRNPGVSLRMRSTQGYDLGRIDRGRLRHPVYRQAGRRARWVTQDVPAASLTAPFEAGADKVRAKLVTALDDVVSDIAKGTSTRGSAQ